MSSNNYFVITPYYKGTALEEIVNSVIVAARHVSAKIRIIGFLEPLDNKLHTEFLDDEKYPVMQARLNEMLLRVRSPKRMLFLDFFNPGLDLLRYTHKQKGILCKYGALLHGGTFLEHDLYNFDWLENFELAWAYVYDKIYAPAYFIAEKFPKNLRNKVVVKSWGMDSFRPASGHNRRYEVIFPHRLNKDKGIDDLYKIARRLPKINFYVTAPQKMNYLKSNDYFKKLSARGNVHILANQTDEMHHKTLAQSKIVLSCACQEIFGFSIMKSVLSGCIPVLPNRQIYPYYFSTDFLYNTIDEACQLIKRYLRDAALPFERLKAVRNRIKNLSFINILKDFYLK